MTALGYNQYRNPAVQKALHEECEQLKDLLAKAHPKGLTTKDLAKKFHQKQGYLLQPHTVAARLRDLADKDEVHVSIQKGKYGAKLYILGPDPKPILTEAQPEATPDTEPPLASDEMLAALDHFEHVLNDKLNRMEELVRRCTVSTSRNAALLTCIAIELGIDTNSIESDGKEE